MPTVVELGSYAQAFGDAAIVRMRAEPLSTAIPSSSFTSLISDTSEKIHIPRFVSSSGLKPYSTQEGVSSGVVNFERVEIALPERRGVKFTVDALSADQQGAFDAIGGLVGRTLRQGVNPELDSLRFSNWAGDAGIKIEKEPSTDGFIGDLLQTLSQVEAGDHYGQRFIFVDARLKYLFFQDRNNQITFDGNAEQKGAYQVMSFAGYPVIFVPTDRFRTNINLDGEGVQWGAGSRFINYLIATQDSVWHAVTRNQISIADPKFVLDADGLDAYKISFLIRHGAGVIKGLESGVAVSTRASMTIGVEPAGKAVK